MSIAGSIASSKRSKGSNYRKVAARSSVEENLFGKPRSNQLRQSLPSVNLQEIRQKLLSGQPVQDAAVIPLAEIHRMKAAAVLKSKEEALAEAKIQDEQREKQFAAAKARKQRMLDLEAQRKLNEPLSDFDIERQARDTAQIAAAKTMQDEEHDDVKGMNGAMLYGRCVTIRDSQINEAHEIWERQKREEERLDLIMEIERLKVIKFNEEREKKYAEDRRKGAMVIQEQIKEREVIRRKEQELLAKERTEMLAQIKRLEEEEAQAATEKVEAQKRLLAEVEESNHRAALLKEERKRAEREEDDKIMTYNIEKAQKEQELQEEADRVRIEKEREVQRLRELQEKAADRQSELDALRAKRAQEAQERALREKERKEAEKRARINREMDEARQKQAKEQEIMLVIQAKQEKQEFDRIIRAQKREADAERMQNDARSKVRQDHARQLLGQIMTNEELRQQDRREYLEEGAQIRKKQEEDRFHVEAIKKKKLQQMIDEGIPEKYCVGLIKKKVNG